MAAMAEDLTDIGPILKVRSWPGVCIQAFATKQPLACLLRFLSLRL